VPVRALPGRVRRLPREAPRRQRGPATAVAPARRRAHRTQHVPARHLASRLRCR
jgi:hypothetical protein